MVLRNLQYNVSVTDITDRENLLFNQQDSCGYSYKNIYFYKRDKNDISSDIYKDGDIVLIMSENCSREIDDICDSIYVVADNSYGMSRYLKEIIRKSEKIEGVVFRDVTDNGINSGYIVRHVIRDDYLFKLFKKGNVWQIADDIIDREYKIALEYEGITNFKNLSGDFIKVISAISEKITKCGIRLVEQALSKAKEGKVIEHCILE